MDLPQRPSDIITGGATDRVATPMIKQASMPKRGEIETSIFHDCVQSKAVRSRKADTLQYEPKPENAIEREDCPDHPPSPPGDSPTTSTCTNQITIERVRRQGQEKEADGDALISPAKKPDANEQQTSRPRKSAACRSHFTILTGESKL
ncbi:hypothetical protein MMC14_008134 [Varicellaria rhodocarpa]|nr:hypothetical protein [Varicellaria rhodocarpa]